MSEPMDPESFAAHVAAIAGQVRRDAKQRGHPLSAELLVWQDGRVREYQPKH